jgi:hypothetical protein
MSTGQQQQGGLIRKVNDPGENNRCVKKKKNWGAFLISAAVYLVCFGCSLLISLLCCCSKSLCDRFLWYYYRPSFHIIYMQAGKV